MIRQLRLAIATCSATLGGIAGALAALTTNTQEE